MPANTAPIFTKAPKVGSVLVTAANTSSQGGGTVGTDIFLAFTAGADGSYIDRVRLIPTGTAATTTTATVGRIFISSIASGSTTSANTWLVGEITLPAIAADNASAAATLYELPLGIGIQGTYTILVTNHAAPAANTAWRAMVLGGDY